MPETESKKPRPVIGRYGYRNERMADGSKKQDTLFAPVEIQFCDTCGRVEKFCTCICTDICTDGRKNG